jgi:hypothetical protein
MLYRVFAQRLPTQKVGCDENGHALFKANFWPVGTATSWEEARKLAINPVLEALPKLRTTASAESQSNPVSATVHLLPKGRNRFLRRSVGMDKTLRAGIVGHAL